MPPTAESFSMAETRVGGSVDMAPGLVPEGAEDPRRAVRATALGISASPTCGVRDYATLLAGALGDENVACSVLWLERRDEALLVARSEVSSWTRKLAAELAERPPRTVLLH